MIGERKNVEGVTKEDNRNKNVFGLRKIRFE